MSRDEVPVNYFKEQVPVNGEGKAKAENWGAP